MRRVTFLSVFFLISLGGVNSSQIKRCRLSEDVKKEVVHYQSFVDNVIKLATKGDYAGKFYKDLSTFIDAFGNRMAGTQNLENAITYLEARMNALGLITHKDPVEVPYWIRGKESATLLTPQSEHFKTSSMGFPKNVNATDVLSNFEETDDSCSKYNMKIKGLGTSVGTGPSGITADVVVVSSFFDLKKNAKKIPGNIVLFNNIFTKYKDTVKYRKKGPAAASKLGAVAALVRSVTPFSIYSPHTGSTVFGNEKPIPAACVTLEDADMMARMYKAGQKITVNLKMEARMAGNRTSNNLIFDLQGDSVPDQYVTVSGHIDSWDVGRGALDDGGGAFLALHSLLLLKSMDIPPPKRTIRGIMWTAEEQGLIGAKTYLENNKEELKNWTAALESDFGIYTPIGLEFSGGSKAYCVLKEILSLFEDLEATTVEKSRTVGSDISVFQPLGVPLIVPLFEETTYMWYHHTDGDSMRALDSSDLDKNLALFAAVSYILANLTNPLHLGPPETGGLLHLNENFPFPTLNLSRIINIG